jgi:hypothetical protein
MNVFKEYSMSSFREHEGTPDIYPGPADSRDPEYRKHISLLRGLDILNIASTETFACEVEISPSAPLQSPQRPHRDVRLKSYGHIFNSNDNEIDPQMPELN